MTEQHPTQPGAQPWPNQPATYGQPPTPPRKRRTPTWLIVTTAVVVAVCGIGTIAAIASSGTDTDQPAGIAAPATTDDMPAEPEPAKPEPVVEETTSPPEPTDPELTASQEQAVGVAQDYLSYSGFSRNGLIEQLEYEGFSNADATFGVDHLDADWKQQAAVVAESYLEYSHFSRQGLIEQLEYEGFTRAQAEYGVTEAGL